MKNKHVEFHSSSGLATKHWGPSGWNFLFSCIMGGYPVQCKHRTLRKHFKSMLLSLQFTMPCIFCRESFKGFVKELPIEPYLKGRIELMHWLYQIRDKVNQKLMTQEQDCYNNEKKRLKHLYYRSIISKDEYYSKLEAFKTITLITQPSPPFIDVLRKYEASRALCSTKAKTCAIPFKKE